MCVYMCVDICVDMCVDMCVYMLYCDIAVKVFVVIEELWVWWNNSFSRCGLCMEFMHADVYTAVLDMSMYMHIYRATADFETWLQEPTSSILTVGSQTKNLHQSTQWGWTVHPERDSRLMYCPARNGSHRTELRRCLILALMCFHRPPRHLVVVEGVPQLTWRFTPLTTQMGKFSQREYIRLIFCQIEQPEIKNLSLTWDQNSFGINLS